MILHYFVEGENERKLIETIKNKYLYSGKIKVMNTIQNKATVRIIQNCNYKAQCSSHSRKCIISNHSKFLKGRTEVSIQRSNRVLGCPILCLQNTNFLQLIQYHILQCFRILSPHKIIIFPTQFFQLCHSSNYKNQ